MKIFKFSLSVIVLTLFVYAGNTPDFIPNLPAMARLMSPSHGFWQQAEAVNKTKESVQLSFDDINGEVVIDEYGIPHIFAADKSDAFFIQGYMHAKDRLWQMDISARAAAGRLAEVLGSGLLEYDRLQKRKGMNVAAERLVKSWRKQKESALILDAYVRGVNSWIAKLDPKDYPLEYKLMGYAPERWSDFKCALFSKSMSESLCSSNRDIESSNTQAALGMPVFAHLFPEHNPQQSPIIPAHTPWPFALPIQNTAIDTDDAGQEDNSLGYLLPYPNLPQSPDIVGSNNWALSGKKTATGSPLLANDPHLHLTLPSIWYEMQIHVPGYNVYGVSLPALPGILIGFNELSAWGITNAGHDVLDWYRIEWTDDTQTKYWLNGKETSPEWQVDTIWIKGQKEPVIEKTPWTVFGPVVYNQADNIRYNLAMRWVAHDAPFDPDHNNITTFIDLGASQGVTAYKESLRGFANPGSNIVYANQDNDIAITVAGHFPARKPQQGRYIQDGSLSENLWSQFIPFEQNAQIVNPDRQFVASANQRSTDSAYPYYYLGSFDDYRGRYINRRLEKMNKATVDDMKNLQTDAYSLRAEDILPTLLSYLEENDWNNDEQEAKILLEKWNYVYAAEATAPIIFNSWYDSLYRLSFDEIYAIRTKENPMLFPEDWRFIDLLKSAPEDSIFDRRLTPLREMAEDLVHLAFRQAVAGLMPKLKSGLDWNAHRATNIKHLGNIPGLGSGLLHSDGTRQTPNALSAHFGPSWRMIVSLEQPIKAWGVLPGGSSGNPGSPFYTRGLKEWQAGEYFELHLFDKAAEISNARQRISF